MIDLNIGFETIDDLTMFITIFQAGEMFVKSNELISKDFDNVCKLVSEEYLNAYRKAKINGHNL